MNKKASDLGIIKSVFLLFIPLILILFTSKELDSISAYVYEAPLLFSFLLTLAGSMFFDEGYTDRRRYFNMVLGLSLFGVLFTPHLDYPILHYTFATIYFLGSGIDIWYFTKSEHKPYTFIGFALIILALIGHFIFGFYSLLYAEWIGMLPASANKILEKLNVIE